MKRVNQYQFYQLASALRPLAEVTRDSTLKSLFFHLYNADVWLTWLGNNNPVPITISRPALDGLHAYVKGTLEQASTDLSVTPPTGNSEKTISGVDAYNLTHSLESFETVYGAEVQALDAYCVAQKLAYVTHDLIEHAEKVLPEECVKVLEPEAVKDIREAGKCVAFELATAVGFHSMRATEKVLRQYFTQVTGKSAKRKDWGKCIKGMTNHNKANPRTLKVLDQVRERRNELMHPETFLSMNDALILFDVAKAAIAAMAQDISALMPQVVAVARP